MKKNLYKIHSDLTDKKLLGTISPEEEQLLNEIRKILEEKDKDLIDSLNKKIEKYEMMLKELEEIKKELKRNKKKLDESDYDNIEHDEFIQMSPVKIWTARIKIKSIEKAKMHIVEP